MLRTLILTSLCAIGLLSACGPGTRDNCVGDACNSGTCNPNDMRDCYTGQMDTQDVGPCHAGTQMCQPSGQWGNCVGEVVPQGENCSDGIDNNCNGMVDELSLIHI